MVNVTVPHDQLTLNRIELHSDDGQTTDVRVYDMCAANLVHSIAVMDDSLFEENLYNSVAWFNSKSYGISEPDMYGFEFFNLPQTKAQNGGIVWARVLDVFGNTLLSSAHSFYECQ